MKRPILRQGDILLVPVTTIPPDARPVAGERRGAGLVVAHGEATGHAHVLSHGDEFVTEARRYVRLAVEARLFHDEHAPIEVPAGEWELRRQREYAPGEIRTVED